MKKLKESTRNELLKSAASEFALHGFVKSNIDTISVNAGFGKGTVYNYFKSKLDLFLTVMRNTLNEIVDEVKDKIKNIEDPIKKLEMAITLDISYIEKNSDLLTTIMKESYTADKSRKDEILEASLPIFDMYVNLIIEGIEAGCYSQNIDAPTIALSIIGSCENLALTNKMLNNQFGTAKDLAKNAMQFILHGIRKT